MDEPELNAAMDRYACGDARAFSAIHGALYPRLLAYLTRMSGSSAVADDLLQETFLRMHRARATFSAGAAVIPWAYAIARNVHVDHARAAKLRTTERLPSDPGSEIADRSGGDAESAAIAAQAARVVERVLARLPTSQRDAFVLIRYEGLSVEDAAAILGTTKSAVKLRAFRAYEALRAELAELRPSLEAPMPDRDPPSGASAAESSPLSIDSLDALTEIPDPAAAIAARRAPPAPPPPASASPTRAERSNRIRFAAALAAAWIAAVIVRFGVRDDLVVPGVLGLLLLWSALAAIGLALTLLPRGRGLPPGIRAVQLALAAIPAIWLATVIARTASAPDVPLTWRTAGACMTLANVIALGPLVVAGLLIRGSFTSAPVLRGAAVGAAVGLLGAVGVHAHCPVEAASHVVVAHGAPLVAGALVGAILGALRGRP